MEKTSQEKEVLDYLRKIGSITSWEAIVEFGATRLSAIIYNLRKKGYNIETNDVIVKNRYGNATVIAKYVLKEGGENEQNNG